MNAVFCFRRRVVVVHLLLLAVLQPPARCLLDLGQQTAHGADGTNPLLAGGIGRALAPGRDLGERVAAPGSFDQY
jgi:hypothetical protein